jgi:hypothetical protein
MPSKKKARAEARKLEKAAASKLNQTLAILKQDWPNGFPRCLHANYPSLERKQDSDDASVLANEVAFHSKSSSTDWFPLIVNDIGPKYDKLSDGAKQVFRKVLLSEGTELVLNIVEHKKTYPGRSMSSQ